MIETSTTSSSFPHSKRKSKIATMLLVSLSMFLAAFVMMSVVKYDAFATIPTETQVSASVNASIAEEALTISRLLQGGGPPGVQTGGKQPLDELLVAVAAVKTDTESIISATQDINGGISKIVADVGDVKADTESIIFNAGETDKVIANIDTNVGDVKTDTESIIFNAGETDKVIANIDTNVGDVKADTESIIFNAGETDKVIANIDTNVGDVKTDTESIIFNAGETDKVIANIDTNVGLLLETYTTSIMNKLIEVQTAQENTKNSLLALWDKMFPPPSLQLSIKATHLCALFRSKVQCVGWNHDGQLGVEPTQFGDSRNNPVTLNYPATATPIKVVTGVRYTCTLLSNKFVYCNGLNEHGQLGSDWTNFPNPSSNSNSFSPIPVLWDGRGLILTHIEDIEAGVKHTCALQTSGTLYCWGDDKHNRLALSGTKNVKLMALAYRDTCVVFKNDPTRIFCRGQTATDSAPYPSLDNRWFELGQEIIKLTAGSYHFCALQANGYARCFGRNKHGQLGSSYGDSTYYNYYYNPPTVLNSNRHQVSGITDINAGGQSTCLITYGTPMCFGANTSSQLGINGITDKSYATELTVRLHPGKLPVSVHVGQHTGHVVFSDNSVYAWGTNWYGCLGDGSEISDINKIGDEDGEAAVKMAFDFDDE